MFPCRRTLGRAMHRKAPHLALAEAPSLFSLSYCVGKTINSVNFCLECLVFNASGVAVCRPQCLAGRWAGRRTERCVAWPWRRRRFFFSVVLCWQNVKFCECLLAMPSFQCIGGGSVPSLMPCRTLGRAVRRIFFSLSYCVGKTLKSVNVCLQCPVFNALGVAVCRPRCLAGRWAGRRAERPVGWPWRRCRIFFLCRIVLAKR